MTVEHEPEPEPKKTIRCPKCRYSHHVPLYRHDFGVPQSGKLDSIICQNCNHLIDSAEIERQTKR